MEKKLGFYTGFISTDFNKVRCFFYYDNSFINAHLDEFEKPEHKVFWLKWLKSQLEIESYNTIDYPELNIESFKSSKKHTISCIEKDIKLWESADTENVKTHTSVKKTYKLYLKEEEVTELYKLLLNNVQISKETKLSTFVYVFSNKEIDINIEKIEWIGAKSLLPYFLDCLYENDIMDNNVDIWAIAKLCFKDATNLRQLKYNYYANKTGKPKNHDIIDKVMTPFLK